MLHLPRHAAPSWMDTWRKNEVSWVPAKALNFRPNSPTPPTQIPRSLTHMVWAWANHIRNEKKLQNTLKNTKMRTATDWPAAPVGSFVRKGSARLRMLSSAVGAICRRVRELWPLLHLPRVTFDPGLPYTLCVWLRRDVLLNESPRSHRRRKYYKLLATEITAFHCDLNGG